ncbi:MAG: DUF445 domain-containing protein [Ilumatobacteraceae bacterium]
MDDTTLLSSADQGRQAALRRMKLFATGLLVAVGVVFLFARWAERTHEWVGYIRAFAEAAMVGALADWFAVTALFKHPLGLPIPHTAIIPNRKDQIGESLGEFVQTNFLTREVLSERLAGAGAGRRLGGWLADPANAARAGGAVADALRGTLQVIDDRDVGEGLERLVAKRVESIPVAPLMGRVIDLAIEGGHQERLLDAVLTGLDGFLVDNQETLRGRLQKESPWWIPEPIDDRIFNKIFSGVQRFLTEVRSTPDHEVRRSIDERLAAFAGRLRADPELLSKGEDLKRELLTHPDVRAWLRSLWGELKRTTLHATMHADSELRLKVDAALVALGSRLQHDPELQAKIDDWVVSTAGYVVDHYKGEAANLISSTVAKWDGKATSQRMELAVGRDLQFIRINGTLVGGLAGLIIYTVSQWLF